MSHPIGEWLQSRLNTEVHRLARCFRSTREDGTEIRVTSHDAKLSVPEAYLAEAYALGDYDQDPFSAVETDGGGTGHWSLGDGEIYSPIDGFDASAARAESALKKSNLELQGVVGSSLVTESDLMAGVWDHAKVDDFWVDWWTPWMGPMRHMVYRLTDFKKDSNTWTAQCVTQTSELQRKVGRVFTRTCWQPFGDSGCGINTEATGVTKFYGKVNARTSESVFTIKDGGSGHNPQNEVDNYFKAGQLHWITGNNKGQVYPISAWVTSSDTLTLQYPCRATVAAEDQFHIYAGCDKLAATCQSTSLSGKTNNFNNFGGFPHLPGTTKISAKNE